MNNTNKTEAQMVVVKNAAMRALDAFEARNYQPALTPWYVIAAQPRTLQEARYVEMWSSWDATRIVARDAQGRKVVLP